MSEIDRIREQINAAPVNIEAIIRGFGLDVRKGANLPAGISGQIKFLPRKNSFEISSSSREHYYRQRFTLAHELGHYILHRSLIGSGVDDNTKYRSTSEGDFYNTSIDLYHEKQANSFAANVLMPERLLHEEIERFTSAGDKVDIIDLYKKFQVSRSAMKWRIENSGLTDKVKI